MDRFDVCIQGAGPVGRSLALALSRQGLSVAWVRPPARAESGPDLRTYALNAASVALLEQLRIWPALPADARTAVVRMRVRGDAEGAQLEFQARSQGLDELAWIVDAAELESALGTALRFAPHVETVDGPVPAALQAFAEGREAAGRERPGVQMPRMPYGQRAIAARLVSDRPHGGEAQQWFRSPDVLALLPFDRPRPGQAYGLVWSVPDERAEALLAMDDAAFEAELAEATGGAAGALRLDGRRAAWPLFLARAEPVCGEGWVLLGDAAHVVHPLAGQGLNLGLADVRELAAVLAARESFRSLGDARLLRRYARRRRGPVQAMTQLTDGLLHLFAHPHPLARELRNRGMTLIDLLPGAKRFLTAQATRS